MPTDPTDLFQRIPDYQIKVDASGNTSELLLMDKTVGAGLREFIESLDVDVTKFLTSEEYKGALDALLAIQAGLVDSATITVDGVAGTVTKVGRELQMSVATENFDDVANLKLTHGISGTGYGQNLTDSLYKSGKTVGVRTWPRMRRVFRTHGAYPVGQDVELTTLDTLVRAPFKNSPEYDPDFITNVNDALGTFQVTKAGIYTFSGSIKLKPTIESTLPAAGTVFQLIMTASTVGGTPTTITSQNMGSVRIGTQFIELDSVIWSAGLDAGATFSIYMAERTNGVDGNTNKLSLWAVLVSAFVEE